MTFATSLSIACPLGIDCATAANGNATASIARYAIRIIGPPFVFAFILCRKCLRL
jgi:hypothetical protein